MQRDGGGGSSRVHAVLEHPPTKASLKTLEISSPSELAASSHLNLFSSAVLVLLLFASGRLNN